MPAPSRCRPPLAASDRVASLAAMLLSLATGLGLAVLASGLRTL